MAQDPQKCVFCRIVRKEIPAKLLFENDHVFAFHDIHPQAPVHVLVIPKVHLDSLQDLASAELSAELLQGVREVVRRLDLGQAGFRTVINTGRDGGQSVDHLHLHVLAGRQLGWPPG